MNLVDPKEAFGGNEDAFLPIDEPKERETGLKPVSTAGDSVPAEVRNTKKRRIILDKGQSPGDILVFTTVLRDLIDQYPDWEIGIASCCNEIFENFPGLSRDLKKGQPGVEFFDVGYEDINNSGASGRHFSNAYYIEIEKVLGVRVNQTSLTPHIYLSDDEKKWINQVHEKCGYKGKYWLICSGNKSDYPLKQWGNDNWQRLVNICNGEIQFVQVGREESGHVHFSLGPQVFNLVGKTQDLRKLIRLAYHAEGAICQVTFLMHLMAAFKKPCVVIAGGREPRRWEMYPNHRYLDTNGTLKCCSYDGCWLSGRIDTNKDGSIIKNERCVNMSGMRPRCMTMITPQQVAHELSLYYRGGVLNHGVEK